MVVALCLRQLWPAGPAPTHPMVVMKLDVKESSENLRRQQDLPTPVVEQEATCSESFQREAASPVGVGQSNTAPRTAVPYQEQLDQVVIIRLPTTTGHTAAAVCVVEGVTS